MFISLLPSQHNQRKFVAININQLGFSLLELIAFIVIISITLTALGFVYQQLMSRNQIILDNSLLYSLAEERLTLVNTRRYDENSEANGLPCDISLPCSDIGVDPGENSNNLQKLDDIDDFNGITDAPMPGVSREISIVYAGGLFGVSERHAKRVTVTVTNTSGESLSLMVYRINE